MPVDLLAVLSFPMAGSSFHRAVDLLRQSLALETKFVVFVSKFLGEKRKKLKKLENELSYSTNGITLEVG